ncbi:hypothetical protein BDW66DRAFT_166026 [Aspergillus desertorum]
MQLFNSISARFLFRTPQPPSETIPPTEPSPPSNVACERPVRNALAPYRKGSGTAPFDPSTQQSTPHSYANSFRTDPRPEYVRRLLRQSTPRPGLGMPKPVRDRDPMRENPSSSIADECRLFGGGKQRDPNAVRVVPGQTFALKPWNTISRGARGSVPVRANGKGRYYTSQSHPLHSEEAPERSPKRRRVEGPEEPQASINISDDDTPAHLSTRGSPVATRSNARSPTPSFSSRTRQPRDYSAGLASEYRTIDKGARVPRPSPKKRASFADRFPSEDADLNFTRDAAKERRKESVLPSGPSHNIQCEVPGHTTNMSVEIVNRPSVTYNTYETPPPRHEKAPASLSRDSPDELQGDVTVGPVPATLSKPRGELPARPLSPDIRPTFFTSQAKFKSGKTKNKRGNAKKGLPARRTFKVFYYRGGPFIKEALGGENDQLIVDPGGGDSGKVTVKIPDSGYVHSVSLRKVLKVVVGEASSRKVRFELSRVGVDDNKYDFELSTADEKEQLCSFLRELKIEVHEKKGDYLDNAFKKSARENQRYTNGLKRPTDMMKSPKEAPKPHTGSTTERMRLSDGQVQNEEAAAQRSPDATPEGRTSPSLAAPTGRNSNSKRAQSPFSRAQRSIGVEIPVKKFCSDLQAPSRAMRSMSRQTPTTLVCDDDDIHEEENTLQPTLDVNQKWDRPLVYPRFGRKKAEVNALDLRRLAPHEFLNDNIIGFYIRFLEDHLQRCSPEVAKRVYFFNSYFFETLTKSPKGLKINYEGVAKWTRNVDIFSYDYIVVPINENAHWYMAIICNLPFLEGIDEEEQPPAAVSRDKVEEVPETPEPQSAEGANATLRSTKEEKARQSLAYMSLLDTQAPQAEESKSGEDEWPEPEDYPDVARAKLADNSSQPQPEPQKDSEASETPKKSRKTKRNRSYGVKYSTCQPIVITFDSLDLSRSGTISILREYLFAEAKFKRGIIIDKSLVKGMTAKEIPHQPNFSDCGLYLLAYVEKFVQDPDSFVRKLLRKEMRKREDWPPLKSGLLRTRLREFMEMLYTEQEQSTTAKADKATLMVDQQPISYLLGDSAADDKVKVENGKSLQSQVQVERSPLAETKPETSSSRQPSAQSVSPKPETGHGVDYANYETQETVQYIDQVPEAQTESTKLEARDKSPKRMVVEVPDSQDQVQTNGPAAAALSTETLPSKPHLQPEHSGFVYIGDSDGVDEYAPQQKNNGVQKADCLVQVEKTPPTSPGAR